MAKIQRMVPCLWFAEEAEEAANISSMPVGVICQDRP